MSLNIGQITSNKDVTWNSSSGIASHSTKIPDGLDRTSFGIYLNTNASQYFNKDENYHLTFQVFHDSKDQEFLVTLKSSQDVEMPIKYFYVEKAKAGGPSHQTCEVSFTPNDSTYTTIVFRNLVSNNLVRVKVEDGRDYVTNTSKPTVENGYYKYFPLKTMKNLVKETPAKSFTQMGIQASPGFMFSMNGQEIHVGKNGVYEISGIPITNLGVYIQPTENGKKQPFIIDYLYEEAQG